MKYPFSRTRRSDATWLILFLCLVTVIWCAHYDRWTREAWKTPLLYSADENPPKAFSGDALWGMAFAKAMAHGEIAPILPKHPTSFGAPFAANWNDFPSSEEGIAAWWALLISLFGLFPGSNLVLLSAHLLSAASFYLVCRYLKYDALFSYAGAILFSFSRYAFWRGLPHLTLTFYWHIPLALLVVWWCVKGGERRSRRQVLVSYAVAFVHGIQNPYYTGIFLQFLAGAAVLSLLRRENWRRTLLPVSVAAVAIATSVSMNLDTIIDRAVHGPNRDAVSRSYPELELYALKPVELLLPFSHSLKALQDWSGRSYFSRTMLPGESGSAYLGWVGIGAAVFLLWSAAAALVRNNAAKIPWHLWGVGWIMIFSVVGGVNGMAGAFGLMFFRSSNRYSVVILALLLLFLVQRLSAWTQNWKPGRTWLVAVPLILLGLFDQVPPRQPEDEAVVREAMNADKHLISELEAKLPGGAMVFQLPVLDFPEAPAPKGMDDYEHFRPYFHARNLRFSYGAGKGRPRDHWQKEVEQLDAPSMIEKLERYGFAAMLINKKGYPDGAAALLQKLATAGRRRLLGSSPDFIGVELKPARVRSLPPEFSAKWFVLEGGPEAGARWSAGDASIILRNPDAAERTALLSFSLSSPTHRNVNITLRGELLSNVLLDPDEPAFSFRATVQLQPGENHLRFDTDRAGERLLNGPKRKLAFALLDFAISE